MTAGAAPGTAADFASLPGWTLGEDQLADVEMLLSGAFAPLTGFMSSADVASVCERGALADGSPWPVPVTLDVPEDAASRVQRRLALSDAERVPVAILDITERSPVLASPLTGPGGHPDGSHPDGSHPDGSGRHARPPGQSVSRMVRLSGPLTPCRELEHGPFRHLRRTPADVREELGGSPVLAVVTRRPVHSRQIGQLRHMAGQIRARVLLLPLVAGPAEEVVRPEALVRAVRAAARHLPPGTLVVPVPLAARDAGPGRRTALHALVAAAYGATSMLADPPRPGYRGGKDAAAGPGQAFPTAIPVVSAGDWGYDRAAEVWRPLSLIEPGTERPDLSAGELGDLLDRGDEVPSWFTPAAVSAELRRARPPRGERGLVIFFTGLSGSGKSTIARSLREALTERGDRTVSLLDGDLVRELLSSGLGFSRADRDLNIARIGFVAAEVARHGGIAICAPIAPYAAARARVREMAAKVGDFLLVHVATPAEVCEARDRKGLYAKARAGLIDHFTGVSDPYEEPRDADVVIDTSTTTRQQALDTMLGLLTREGWLAG